MMSVLELGTMYVFRFLSADVDSKKFGLSVLLVPCYLRHRNHVCGYALNRLVIVPPSLTSH
jgi:hypothetical protein